MKEYYQSSYRIMFDIMDGLVGFNVSGRRATARDINPADQQEPTYLMFCRHACPFGIYMYLGIPNNKYE